MVKIFIQTPERVAYTVRLTITAAPVLPPFFALSLQYLQKMNAIVYYFKMLFIFIFFASNTSLASNTSVGTGANNDEQDLIYY